MNGPEFRPHCRRASGRDLASAIVVAVLICGCSSQDPPETPTQAADIQAAEAFSQPDKPAGKKDRSHPTVEIETTAGRIVVKLNTEKAPGTVQNFLDYVNEDFYSGTLFHFVDPGRMILGGGYTADGELKETRISILNEAHNGLKNTRGTVAMARNPAQIDGSTTQFFINLVDSPEFDHEEDNPDNYGYCVFGTVVEGLEIAEEISQAPTHDRGGDLVQTPQTQVVIESMQVTM